MLAKVVKGFSYSDDGLVARDLSPGDTLEIPDDLALGLMIENYIIEANAPEPIATYVAPSARHYAEIEHGLDEHEGVETKVGDGELHIKHIGRGKYAVMRGGERLTHDPLDKHEAESALADMLDAIK